MTVNLVNAPGVNFYNLVIDVRDTYTNGSGSGGSNNPLLEITSGQTVNVLNTLTMSDGKVMGGKINLYGNLVLECLSSNVCAGGGTTEIAFLGGANQTFSKAADALESDGTFIVNKSAGTLSLLSQMDLDATGQDLQVLGGTLSLGAFDLRLDDQLTVNTPGVVDASGAGSVVYINGGCSGTGVCP